MSQVLNTKLNKTYIKKLQDLWGKQNDIHFILEQITQDFKLTSSFLPEIDQRLLFGICPVHARNGLIQEHVTGKLLALGPGIILLDSTNNVFSGLLKRSPANRESVFYLEPFNRSTDLYINPYQPNMKPLLCADFPVSIDWSFGSGQGEDYGRLAIEKTRWQVLEPWLNKWLPENK